MSTTACPTNAFSFVSSIAAVPAVVVIRVSALQRRSPMGLRGKRACRRGGGHPCPPRNLRSVVATDVRWPDPTQGGSSDERSLGDQTAHSVRPFGRDITWQP